MTRRAGPRGSRIPALLALVPAGFLGLFFCWPLVAIIGRGFEGAAITEAATDDRLRQVAWFTLWQATASTGLTLALGLPAAFVVGRYRFRGAAAAAAMLTAPFVLPTVVVGAAFLALLPASLDRSVWAIVLAHAFFNVSVVVRTVAPAWSRIDTRLAEAARTLGASPVRAGIFVTAPLLSPAIIAASTIVFLFTFGSFGVVQILGGPTRSTIETEIYRQTAQLLRLDRAAALAMFQLAALSVLLWVTSRAQLRRSVSVRTTRAEHRVAPRWPIVAGVLAPLLLLVVTPLAVLVERSLRVARSGGGYDYSLTHYRLLFEETPGTGLAGAPIAAVGQSLRVALVATTIAFAIGSIAVFASARFSGKLATLVDAALSLPLGTSAVTLGFGFLIAFAAPPLDWRSKWFAVPLVQAVVGMPFVVRVVRPVLQGVDPRLREAAAVLGASPGRAWREVDLALAVPALAVGAGTAFAVSLGEFGATTVLVRPETVTLPVAIARLLGRPGPRASGQALALSVILALLTIAVVAAVAAARRSTRLPPETW